MDVVDDFMWTRFLGMGALGFILPVTMTLGLLSCKSPETLDATSGVKAVVDTDEFLDSQVVVDLDSRTGAVEVSFTAQDDAIANDQELTLVWDYVSSSSAATVKCSSLKKRQPFRAEIAGGLGNLRFSVDPAKLVHPVTKPDPQGRAKWDMDAGGVWAGPMRVEACIVNPAGDAVGKGKSGRKNGFGLAGADADIHRFGDICASKLGKLPAFSCLDDELFETIPIEITENGFKRDLNQPGDVCDHPIYLPTGGNGYCKPWARIGRIKTGPDSMAAVVCRRYWPDGSQTNSQGAGSGIPLQYRTSASAPSDVVDADQYKRNPSGPDDPYFNDVAVIQHNTRTGETCFFQALGTLYGDRVPPPTERKVPNNVRSAHPEARDAESFWLTPQGTAGIFCNNCHDADPWMHSPYVHYAKKNGSTWIPSSPDSPYIILGAEFGFDQWSVSYNIEPQDTACTACHRLGSLNSCSTWIQDASGLQNHAGSFAEAKSPHGRNFRKAHWMPPSAEFDADLAERIVNKADWDAKYGRALQQLDACCNVPGARLGLGGNPFSASSNYGLRLTNSQIRRLEDAGCNVTPNLQIVRGNGD